MQTLALRHGSFARIHRIALAACALLAALARTTPADAFTTQSGVTVGCHETVTLGAIDDAGWPAGTSPPPLDPTEQRVAADLIFDLPAARRDPWSLAMLLGVRHVDLLGFEPSNLPAIVVEAGRPESQRDHCLRAPGDDGDAGNASALAQCRAYILENVIAAMGPGEALELQGTERTTVALDARGPIEVAVNRFGFRMGMALHAVQDGFTHAFRAAGPDGRLTRVQLVLNYADFVGDARFDPARDGHPHLSGLDRCTGVSATQQRRVDNARRASADLLRAVGGAASSRAERLARVDAVLADWFTYVPYAAGCGEANQYCGATEIRDGATGCTARGGRDHGAAKGAGILLAVIAALGARVASRRRRRAAGHSVGLAAAAALALALLPRSAAAQSDAGAAAAPDAATVPPAVQTTPPGEPTATPDVSPQHAGGAMEPAVERAEQTPGVRVVAVNHGSREMVIVEQRRVDARDLGAPVNRGLGAYLGITAALDRGGFAGTLGLRYDLSSRFALGLDAEYNPWFSLTSGRFAPGTANVYLTGVVKWGAIGSLEIRTTASAGASVLTFDLVGANAGSVGPFVGLTPLGVAWRATRALRIVADPGGFFLSVPQVQGIPLVVTQHRFTLGIQWTP